MIVAQFPQTTVKNAVTHNQKGNTALTEGCSAFRVSTHTPPSCTYKHNQDRMSKVKLTGGFM